MDTRGLSQRRLASMMGVSQPNVSQLLNGVRKPDLDVIDRLSEVLECDPSEFLSPVDEKIPA